jgi:hypothetical protein
MLLCLAPPAPESLTFLSLLSVLCLACLDEPPPLPLLKISSPAFYESKRSQGGVEGFNLELKV